MGLRFLIILLASVSAARAAAAPHFAGVRLSRPTHELVVLNQGVDTPEGVGGQSLTYGTWDPFLVGGFLSFGHFAIGYAGTPANGEDASEVQELRLSYWHERFGLQLGSAHAKNFRIIGGSVFDSLGPGEIRRSDMKYDNATAQLTWALIDLGLHLDNAFEPAEYPKRTGGALVTIASLDRMTLDGNTALIPGSQQTVFLQDGGFRSGDFLSANLSLGWGQALALGNFYVSGLFAIGMGRARYTFETDSGETSRGTVSNKDHLILGSGYSGARFFTAGQFTAESPEYVLRSISLQTSRQELIFYSGVKW